MIYFGKNKMPDFCNRRHPFHYTTALDLLLHMGVDLERVDILAVGEYENYKGEIREQQPSPDSEINARSRIVLKIGYPSAVDQLPYQFFYGLKGMSARGSDWDMKARQMMAPYDAAVIRYNAAMRYQALKYSFGVVNEGHNTRFLSLFDFDIARDAKDVDEAVIWASLMPEFHLWGGNSERVEEVLRLLFGYRFRIVENIRSDYEIPIDIRYRLGSKSGRLGRETAIGRTFSECDSTYQVIVSGVKRQEMASFVPGGANRKKLERVLRICMPNDLDYKITFEIENRAMIIGEAEKGSYLGYTTHLQPGGGKRQYQRRQEN